MRLADPDSKSSTLFWSLAIAFIASLLWVAHHGPLGSGGFRFVAAYAAGFLLFIALLHSWPQRAGALTLVLLAIVARTVMLPFPHNDDLYRYLWEGHIQKFGFNPYLLAPDSPQLTAIRTAWWSSINHRAIPTIYFPLAQVLFRGITFVSLQPLVFKLMLVAFDLGAVIVLLRVCRFQGLPVSRVAMYALNPLVLISVAGEGHLEGMVVFFVSLTILFTLTHRHFFSFLSIGASFMVKMNTVIFIPFLANRKNTLYLAAILLPASLFFLYYQEGVNYFKVPLLFGASFSFNGPLFFIFSLGAPAPTAALACWSLYALFLGAVFFLQPNPLRACFLAATGFIVCSPTLHPWYLLLVTPFLVLFPSPSLLLLHATIGLVFPVYARYWETGIWQESHWIRAAEFIPVAVVAIWYIAKGPRWGMYHYANPNTVAVVIPAFNEENSIARAIASVRNQTISVSEIVVVDGGSEDGTASAVAAMPDVRFLRSPRGRGIQIARGIESTTSDIIVVLHADSTLSPRALKEMVHELRKNPRSPGGAFGASFSDNRRRMHLVSFLNNMRASVFGISFGDQAQFIRRSALDSPFPEFKLMEDVELSMRFKEKGGSIFIPRGIQSSNRRWMRVNYLGNFTKVIYLTILYILQRRLTGIRNQGEWYYKAYYGAMP